MDSALIAVSVFRTLPLLRQSLPARPSIDFDIISPPYIELRGGNFVGLRTIKRSTKDSVMTNTNNKSFHFDFHVAFEKFIADYTDAKINGQPVSGEIRAKTSSFRTSFTAKYDKENDECDIEPGAFELESIDGVTLTDRDGKVTDITEVVVKHALPEINEQLSRPEFKGSFMNGVKLGFCQTVRERIQRTRGYRHIRSPGNMERLTSIIAQDLLPNSNF